MSRARVLWAVSIATGVLVACSGDDSVSPINSGTDSGTDATVSDGSSGGTDSAPLPDVSLPDVNQGGGPIACGQATTCDSKTQDCCLENPLVCAPKGTCPGGYLSCSGTLSCPAGDVCCAAVVRGDGGGGGDGGDGGGGGATATATCAPAACGKGELQLCTDNNDCKIAGEECRRGPGGLKGCRKIQDGGGGDGGDASTDGGDSG